MYHLRFVYPWVLFIGIPCLIIALLYRKYRYTFTTYTFPLTHFINERNLSTSFIGGTIGFLMRGISLLLLLFLVARPQFVDVNAEVHVEGIDIMLVLDVSGSMQFFDDMHDRRTRIEVAKQEALSFIEKRKNDPLGVVLFGREVISRCPLTLDKQLLREIVAGINLGDIDADGTALSLGILTAINRLKSSKAASKIMIVLTDGEPTPEVDIPPQNAIEMAQKYGIKIYTIGIGGDHGGLFNDPIFGIRPMGFRLNSDLLNYFSEQTGGQFFEAKKPADVERIYSIIDTLETTEYDTTIYNRYYDFFFPILIIVMALLFFEWCAHATWWFIV